MDGQVGLFEGSLLALLNGEKGWECGWERSEGETTEEKEEGSEENSASTLKEGPPRRNAKLMSSRRRSFSDG